ncbi:5-formyltetrahydrofolate cyclo-ligase [Bacillus marinisedimentorum]|uniref:5-formyltetrahydrofolate cyclo-ligase n=1 Tax=Bacillus marinisedimentorum TaxID=1821260 RepID=UPI0007E1F797|nr:5-formyltetrahydrofolate cyclo-ligase [Bacillus marinisedimentorum]
MEQKEQLRKKAKEKLQQMDSAEKWNLEQGIYRNLFEQPEWEKADTIGVTISMPLELNTAPIIEKAWSEGKKVAVPKCLPEKKELQFRILTDFSELEVVYYGLKEPILERTERVHKNRIDLLIVPGLLFQQEGYRIGFGGGYYDRFLTDFAGRTASLAYSWQADSSFQAEDHDIPVDKVITENKVYDGLSS